MPVDERTKGPKSYREKKSKKAKNIVSVAAVGGGEKSRLLCDPESESTTINMQQRQQKKGNN